VAQLARHDAQIDPYPKDLPMNRILVSLLLALAVAAPALAQLKSNVQFEPGNYGTMVNGSIKGRDYVDYTLGAKGGQEMFVELTVTDSNGNGTVYFNILPPGEEFVAIYNGSMDGTTARIDLPETGSYTIRVYLMGNDRDTGATVDFNLDLSLQ
jgi:hypothetical protein